MLYPSAGLPRHALNVKPSSGGDSHNFRSFHHFRNDLITSYVHSRKIVYSRELYFLCTSISNYGHCEAILQTYCDYHGLLLQFQLKFRDNYNFPDFATTAHVFGAESKLRRHWILL